MFSTPAYAETHFKFKLPWSLLYRPWPEIIVDAPFQFVPGVEPFLYIVMRDADKFPVTIDFLRISFVQHSLFTKESITFERTFELSVNVQEPFRFIPLKLGYLKPALYELHVDVCVRKGTSVFTFKRWNLPFLKSEPLRIRVLGENLPQAPGFVVGDMHVHSYYSADHVEFGAKPSVLQEAARAVGLDFVSITDHAYDFAFDHVNYTVETDPHSRFSSLKKEIEELSLYPLLLAGEEVSMGNSKGENVHVTVFDAENYLPGLGDCGRYWLHNKPTLKIEEALKMTQSPCFAAHPFQQMGMLEKFIFRRGYWTNKDLCLHLKNPICGIQFFNGVIDEGFSLGKSFWIQELSKGNFLLPVAGNDAHGDLNDTTSNAMPLISLKRTRNHVFGFARTAIKLNGALHAKNLKNAFVHGANVFITNGPALWFERVNSSALLFAKSNASLGPFRYVRIFGRKTLPNGKLSPKEELLKESGVAFPNEISIKVRFDDFCYLRAECETSTGRIALTSAFLQESK